MPETVLMKSRLKAVLALAVVVALAVSLHPGRQALDASPIATPVVTVRPAVTPDVIRVTYFSSDVRCYTRVRIEQLTRQTVERHFVTWPLRRDAHQRRPCCGLAGSPHLDQSVSAGEERSGDLVPARRLDSSRRWSQ